MPGGFLEAAFKQLMEHGEVVFEHRLRHRNGDILPVEVSARLINIEGRRVAQALVRDLSERTRIDEKVRAAKELLEGTFASLSAAVFVVDAETRKILACNPAVGSMFGYRQDEVLNRDPGMLHIDAAADEAFRADLYKNLDQGRPFHTECQMRRRDGSVFPTSHTVTEIRGAGGRRTVLVSVVRDISERQQAEQAQRDSVQRYQTLFDHVTDSILVVDPETHRLIEVNAVAAEVLGYCRQELIDLTLDDLVGKSNAAEITATIDDVVISGAAHFEASMRRQDASLMPVEASVRTVEVQGRLVLQAILRDISERREMAEQLGRALRLEAVGRLTGGIAHDFNNILTIIITNLHFLTEELEDGVVEEEDLRVMVDAALEAATRGSDVTHRLLAFSRQESLQPQSFDVAKLVSDTTRLLAPALGETVKLETRIAEDLAAPYADRGHLQNALVNLAVNARDARPEGGTLSIEVANAELSRDDFEDRRGACPGSYVMVAVRDTGSGISADMLEHIFEPFFSTKDKSANSGLGLSMVHGFAMQSSGHIEVESEVGSGTVIRLYLPRASETERLDSAAEPSRAMPGGNETVLLVEDEVAVRRTLSQSLERLGYTVLAAGDGQQALDILETEDFDLLVTDLVMPGGLSGLDLVRETRARRPATKVLYISGYAEALEHLSDILEPGDRYLSKPFRQSQLATMRREVLEAR
ncbi:MAG TPA: PAS domain S-box protein [Alphaproteobacteria bacterium]|nr:PAS domain S-box protein [Alphaproteobacteria bacterium]